LENFGRYQLLKKLATGGMAQIYLARQVGPEGFEKLLVLKRILPHLAENQDFITMFLDEARVAARLNHPNVVQIFDLGAQDASYFIAMEYIHGDDARRLAKQAERQGSPIPLALICRIIIEACAGLDYAHKKVDQSGRPLNIVHRDISPQNILVSFEGGVKIVDFGIAKAADQATVTRSGVLKGKYSYMSPEQAAGAPIDHRTDIFALGVVLYELLTGTRLFKRANDILTLNAVTDCRVAPPSTVKAGVPVELDAIVMKALAKDRTQRYAEAKHFGAVLEAWLLENRLPSSTAHLAEYLHALYAERLAREAEEGRLLIESLDASRSEEQQAEAGPAPETDPRRTRSQRTTQGPSPIARARTVPSQSLLRPRQTADLPSRPAVAQPQPETVVLPPRQAVELPPREAVALAARAAALGPLGAGDSTLTDPGTVPPAQTNSRLRLMAGLAVAAVLFGGGTALLLLLKAPSLRLSSTPPGATVTLDGTEVCAATPCVTGALAPGDHELVVTREGYRALNVAVTVPSRGEREVPTFVLSAHDGDERTRLVSFTLTSRPPGASVILNGKNLGRTPIEVSLQEGARAALRLELKDYLPHAETFTASAEPRTFELEPAPPGKSPGTEPQIRPVGRGTVLFVVEPWATVVCGSYRFGETPFPAQAMNAGVYVCHFKNTNGEKSERLEVEPGVFKKVFVTVP
jgi:serine/threonine protein kinase